MVILFPVKREMAILFFVKRDLDPPLPPSSVLFYYTSSDVPMRHLLEEFRITKKPLQSN